jgi:hypothetical protein
MSAIDPSPVPIKKISVEIHGIGGYRNVHTVADLASILLSDQWPKRAGTTTFQRALAQCLMALENQSRGDVARKAFVEAARDAGVTVLPDDVPLQQKAPPPLRNSPRPAVTGRRPSKTPVAPSRA